MGSKDAVIGHWISSSDYVDFYDNSLKRKKEATFIQSKPQNIYFTTHDIIFVNGNQIVKKTYQINHIYMNVLDITMGKGENWILHFSKENTEMIINEAPVLNSRFSNGVHTYRYHYYFKDNKMTTPSLKMQLQ